MKADSMRGLLARTSAVLIVAMGVIGCGTPGAPLPPSLKLPDPVIDLAATRAGDQVSLTWTMPKKNTDKLLIKGNIAAQVCRKEAKGTCVPVPATLSFAPNAKATFTDTLPPSLASGPPRSLDYFVELKNGKGRSAGLSNAATVLAGAAPPPVTALAATVRKDGVVLRWAPASTVGPAVVVVRLQRKLLTPLRKKPEAASGAQPGILAPAREPIEVNLLAEPADSEGQRVDRTLDKNIHFGETYEYRAQRVARVTVEDQELELAGPLSEPVRVEAIDVFPPNVPRGLAAVATAPDQPGGSSIDLSWQPVTNPDLAGYAVYRRESTQPEGSWDRISPVQPVVGPGFHDANVQPGHTYRYAVTAIDQGGHESARSAPAEETVPNP